MSDRGRGGRGGGGERGRGRGNDRGGRGGAGGRGGGRGGGAGAGGGAEERKSILDLSRYQDKGIHVKFVGGREVTGILKGHDPLLNLVLDEAVEQLRDPSDPTRLSGKTRQLGLLVCRGTAVVLISPLDGLEEIENPFVRPT